MSAVDGTLFYSGYSGVTPIQVGNLLKRTFSDDERALVVELISFAEDEFARSCNRNFKDDLTYYEYFDTGFTRVNLLNTPIKSLTAVVVDGMDRTANYTENTHYWIYNSFIQFYPTSLARHCIRPFNSSTPSRNSGVTTSSSCLLNGWPMTF